MHLNLSLPSVYPDLVREIENMGFYSGSWAVSLVEKRAGFVDSQFLLSVLELGFQRPLVRHLVLLELEES
jgi:hypothetical protein